jgi:hypothetical protein
VRGVVFDQGELRPAHCFGGPRRGGPSGAGRGCLGPESGCDVCDGGAGAGDRGGLQELPTRERGLAHARYGT